MDNGIDHSIIDSPDEAPYGLACAILVRLSIAARADITPTKPKKRWDVVCEVYQSFNRLFCQFGRKIRSAANTVYAKKP